MPGGDGTGPGGYGPKTGRGAGYCAGNNTQGYTNTRTVGRGMQNRTSNNRSFFKRGRSLIERYTRGTGNYGSGRRFGGRGRR